ncbi:Nicalin [Eumeta japonica]|uniref:BOS complex subunit NCLN n=1 Tax=Eumeta variegata TaxID=151549 RepID=A0A4C1XMR6_EUMVA|nr:Nicalin [Eumeta japonica]
METLGCVASADDARLFSPISLLVKMWLDEVDGFAELFRGYLPYYLFVALPIFIIMSPVNPVAASHEFSIYRMQQYDLHTVPHGCRSSNINLEGRSLTSWSTSRHCVVARIQDMTIDQFMEIRSKAGALLLVLPKNNTLLTKDEKEHIQLLEMAMSQQELSAPVYFLKWSPEVEEILDDLQHSIITDDKSRTAVEAMLNTVSSNGYQIVVTAPSPQKIESKAITLHGKLTGRSSTPQTIVIVAHYDASAIAPELATGADSNASGAVAVLELARIFSRLYSSKSTHGNPSLLFVLTGTGHTLNYFSAKKWLEDQLDSTDSSSLQDVSFVTCLDSISSSSELIMHVSKPPKPGGAAHSLASRLQAPLTHKKINLADEVLAWQHERFSIRRMTAFTISCLQSHKDSTRSSILDIPSEKAVDQLVDNVRRLARALASHIYNVTSENGEEDAALYDDALVTLARKDPYSPSMDARRRRACAPSTKDLCTAAYRLRSRCAWLGLAYSGMLYPYVLLRVYIRCKPRTDCAFQVRVAWLRVPSP